MDEADLGSGHAIEVIEGVLWNQPSRITELWGWGYEFGLMEMHRWLAGVLHGHWLTTPDEHPDVAPAFARFREQVEQLNIVDHVDVEVSQDEENISGEPLVGEKWAIHFSQHIEYDHRSPDRR